MENALKKSRKNERKQRKCQIILEKETGIKCISTPTVNLAICNAGLSNGLKAEVVMESFINYGAISKLTMLPGKSCCFLSYKEIKSAVEAYEAINGVLNIAQDNKPIYLGFTNDIPESDYTFNSKPPGLIVFEDFISIDEERLLLALNSFEDTNALKHRQVKHYGYEFRYDINNVDKDQPLNIKIPEECEFLWNKLKGFEINFEPDQLTVNCYKPGQGIPSHVDTHSAFEDPLISLSLGSSTVMDFKHKDGRHCQVFLPARSLCIISQESRYDWTHGITPRKMDVLNFGGGLTVEKRGTRVSFTFRKVRQGECDCIFKDKCDSYAKMFGKNTELGDEVAAKLESMHVHEVYENIANHFSDTRHTPWPHVLDFINSLEIGSILVDVGCGNGKYLGTNNIYDIGCDRSYGLIAVCKQRGHEVFSCNCLNIPIKNCVANGVISIAVIHHLANEVRRKLAISEMIRILDINGCGLIYVWAKDQAINKEKSSYLKQDRKNRKIDGNIRAEKEISVSISEEISLPVHTNRKQFEHQDVLVPWKLKKEQVVENEFLRFYHVFEEGELEKLIGSFDNVQIVKSYYDQGNWCVIFKKIK